MTAPVQINESSVLAAATSISVTQTTNPVVGHTNIVWVRNVTGATVSSVTDTLGHTYTARGSVTEAVTLELLSQFTAPITTSGANTVTANYSASIGTRGITVIEVAGTYDASATLTDATFTNPSASISATNTAQPATVYALCNDVQNNIPGLGAGYTNAGTGWATATSPFRAQYKEVTATGSQSANFGNSAADRLNLGMIIVLDLPTGPTINTQPTDQYANVGATATFTISATTSGGALSYQWKANGSNVGSNSASYTTGTLTNSNQWDSITCDVTDSNGTVVSTAVRVVIAFTVTGTGPRRRNIVGAHPVGTLRWLGVAAGSGSTGTLATTNANDTLSASGTNTITGTVARTNANDTLAASGSTTVTGTVATTNADDTLAASGVIGGSTGTLSYTNANDTLAGVGTTTVGGTLARTNANDSLAASGSPIVSGALAATNANDTLAATGTNTITGTVATTNADDTLSASGAVGGTVTGTLAYANNDDTLGASGFTTITGLLSHSNNDDSLAATGNVVSITSQQSSGGWDLYPAWRKKTKKEIEEERERFGIIPKKVKEAIVDAAVQYAAEPDRPPVMEAFDNATADFERKYEAYFRYEVARQLRFMQQEEEEEFMMLMH